MELEIDLLELVKVLLNKLWILVICLIIGALLGLGLSKLVLPKEYESNTTMYVMNYDPAYQVPDSGGIDQGDLTTSKSLASTYITVLKSDSVMREVGRKLFERLTEETISEAFTITEEGNIDTNVIKNSFTMAPVDDTEVIRITARTENPEVSSELCNILAGVAPDFLLSVVKAGSVEIIDEAFPDEKPVSPNVSRNTILGALMGLILSIAVILLLFLMDDTVKEKDKITEKFDRPVLGEILKMTEEDPKKKKKRNLKFKRKKKRQGDDADQKRILLTDQKVSFSVTESYKTLRTNILYSLGTSGKRAFVVTSVNPGEGKSTTAANIAIAFAQTGSKVLLIDADMRKPVQHMNFSVKNKEGLSSLIVQLSDLSESIRHTSVTGLDLIPSGPIPPNPSELLASDRFNELMRLFQDSYDFVILDTPPVSVVTDAMVMKDSISGILLVLKHGSTKEQDIAECIRRFEFSNVNLLGFVLNAIEQKSGIGYYRRKKDGYGNYESYGYGYGYGRSGAEMKEYIPDAEVPEEPEMIKDGPAGGHAEGTDEDQKVPLTSVEKEIVKRSEDMQNDRLSLSHSSTDRRRIKERRDVIEDDSYDEGAGSETHRGDTPLLRPQRTRRQTFFRQAPGSVSENSDSRSQK